MVSFPCLLRLFGKDTFEDDAEGWKESRSTSHADEGVRVRSLTPGEVQFRLYPGESHRAYSYLGQGVSGKKIKHIRYKFFLRGRRGEPTNHPWELYPKLRNIYQIW